MDDLTVFTPNLFLAEYMLTFHDRNSMGVCLKSLNDGKDKYFKLLQDQETYHVDVISSTKSLFMVRNYSYICHKGCLSCVQEAAACFAVNQSAKTALVALRTLMCQVNEQDSSVKPAVLS